MSNKMLEIKKLKDFMKVRGIQEGEQFEMLPLTNWYMFDDCFGQIIGLFDEQELNENYIVLTDRPFKLKFEDILEVRNHLNIPILRKDFMVDEYQFYEAKSIGADVILLIAACLSPTQVSEFTDLAHQLHLEVLLEIHSEEELNHINKSIDFVGINNRNLKDFKVDLQHSVNLKNQLPSDIFSIAESGIYNEEDFKFLKEKGFDGFLMGEYFMKNENPGQKFGKFLTNVTL